jgi:3-deoxy-D-manno-octulosonate 8-phosphate phosphatase (KDO 8-P phosphatase)
VLEIHKKMSSIRLLAFDVDGVLTDNHVWMNEVGQWRRTFSVRDGYGIQMLRECGYQVAIITGSNSDDVRERARILKMNFFYEGTLDKLPAYEDIKSKTGFSDAEILYMGDDLFDLPLIERAGVGVTVPEASGNIKEKSDFVTTQPGGKGAVREVCDLVLLNGFYRGKLK